VLEVAWLGQLLLFLHFLGLMLGAAGGFASGLIMRRAAAMPAEQAKSVRSLGPMLANVSATGLAILWLTGLALVWSRWGGFGNLPGLFWVKLVFVVALTGATGLIHATYARVRRGNVAAAAWLPRLGPAAGLSSLLAVLFAVYAFEAG
jgi:uncharacterized membrane protein